MSTTTCNHQIAILQAMYHPALRLIAIGLLLFGDCGCDRFEPVSQVAPAPMPPSDPDELLNAIAESERDAANAEPPAPNISLATPPGWTRSEPRALPPEDHGFTVAFQHDSGMTVTLYQFTRGLTVIPNDVSSPAIKEEMEHAKNGIEQAVQLGYWQAAEESESRTVQLGNSQQQALWSQYHLTIDGKILASDIYVWAKGNTFFKVRCTCRSEDVISNQAILGPLLTAFGSSDADVTEGAR